MNDTENNNSDKIRLYRISTVILFIIILILFSLLVCPHREEEKRQQKITDLAPEKVFIPDDPQRHYNESKIEKVRRPIIKEKPRSIITDNERKIIDSFLPNAPEWLEEQDSYQLIVQFAVTGSGDVASIGIAKSTGLIELDDYLVKYLKKWKFDESYNDLEKSTVVINYEIE